MTNLTELQEEIIRVLPEIGEMPEYVKVGNVQYKRQIQLTDVLRVLNSELPRDETVAVSPNGAIELLKNKGTKKPITLVEKTFWNLTKPLHEQSEETINFLHSIICKK